MRLEDCRVLSNESVATNTYLLRLLGKDIPRLAKPGQFVMLKLGAPLDPLLRRPFSVFKAFEEEFWILYKKVGKGTSLMVQLSTHQIVSVMGPLGNGFFSQSGELHLLVGGGIGLAGIGLLEERLEGEKKVVLGFKCGTDVPSSLIKDHHLLFTEDGSMGVKGTVLDGIEQILLANSGKRALCLYACGSLGMLQAVSNLCRSLGIRCQVLMESIMACGVGACQGCVIKTTKGYKRACKDGPVFWEDQLIWDNST